MEMCLTQCISESTPKSKISDPASTPCSSVSDVSETVPVKRRRIEKPKEDALIDPFPLPKNFRPDVELALQSGQMTNETRKSFISQVAGAIYTFKKYPTTNELENVCKEIVKLYPFMGYKNPKTGNVEVGALVGTLSQRFRELRRPPRHRLFKPSESSESENIVKLLKPLQTSKLLTSISIPPGEDSASFSRNNSKLIAESRKAKPNLAAIQSLIIVTFPFRRNDILKGKDLSCIKEDYPYLTKCDCLFADMDEIMKDNGTSRTSVTESWNEIWAPRIKNQAKLERKSNSKLNSSMKSFSSCESAMISLLYLPYLLKDSKSTPDHKRVVQIISISSDIQAIIDNTDQNEPYLIFVGEVDNPSQMFIIIEKNIYTEIPVSCFPDYLYGLLSTFFVLNLCYPKGCNNMYLFLEYCILGLNSKVPASVTHFISSLQSVQSS
jgi:hypothetical protein